MAKRRWKSKAVRSELISPPPAGAPLFGLGIGTSSRIAVASFEQKPLQLIRIELGQKGADVMLGTPGLHEKVRHRIRHFGGLQQCALQKYASNVATFEHSFVATFMITHNWTGYRVPAIRFRGLRRNLETISPTYFPRFTEKCSTFFAVLFLEFRLVVGQYFCLPSRNLSCFQADRPGHLMKIK